MVAVRSAVYFIAMVISVFLFGLAMITVGRLGSVAFRDAIATSWGCVNLWLMKVICGLRYRIQGAENLPSAGVIVMSKHQSTWETISLRCLLTKQQSWILKQELMQIPVFGWALASIPTIAIDRGAGRKAVRQIIEQGIGLLGQGRIVVVFPEGTRTAPGEKRKYGIGGAMLAAKSGCPVIPIAHNAGVFWKRRGLHKYPGTIDVVVGKPIESKDKKAGEINHEVEQWIESTMTALPDKIH